MLKHQTTKESTQVLCPYCTVAVKLAGSGLSNHFFCNPSCHHQHDKSRNMSKNIQSQDLDTSRLKDHGAGSAGAIDGQPGNIGTGHRVPKDGEGHTGSHSVDGDKTLTLSGLVNEDYPTSGYIIYEDGNAGHVFQDCQPTRYENLRNHEVPANPSAPWSSEDEWELVEWLMSVHIFQAVINCFLDLKWVCEQKWQILLHFLTLCFLLGLQTLRCTKLLIKGSPWENPEYARQPTMDVDWDHTQGCTEQAPDTLLLQPGWVCQHIISESILQGLNGFCSKMGVWSWWYD